VTIEGRSAHRKGRSTPQTPRIANGAAGGPLRLRRSATFALVPSTTSRCAGHSRRRTFRALVRADGATWTGAMAGTPRAWFRGMSKPIPTIQKYMTTSPHSIGVEQPLSRAHDMMRQFGIRHLPVLHGGKLVGMLTDRDLHLVESLAGVDPTKVKVEDAMATVVYAVPPESPLDEVVDTMGEHKYGSAVIMQNEKVVGIFTTVDVCRALAELLRTRLAK
jgi:acetoin utilization protein AcuB